MVSFKNILIVRTDRMGDVVLTTPAIKALRDQFPDTRISILVAHSTQDIVLGNPYLNEVIVEDRKKEHRGFWGTLKLIRLISQKRFDLAIIYHTKRRTNLICFLAGIPYRLGYKNEKWGFLLTDPIKDDRPLGVKHEAQYCLDVLKPLGIKTGNLDLYVSVSQQGQEWLQKFLFEHKINPQDKLIAVHPGASDMARGWPPQKFAQLIEKVVQAYHCKIIFVGDKRIEDVVQEILKFYKGPYLSLIGHTRLFELISLLKRANLLFSIDSGPVHIAAGLGTPVVSIFTRNQPGINPERWRPLGALSRFVSVAPNMEISYKKAGTGPSKDAELITAQQVFEIIDALMKSC